MDNPIQQVYDAIWHLIESNEELTELVKLNNRIRFEDRDPMKDEISTSDLPEIRLVPVGGSSSQGISSSQDRLIKRFRIDISSGTQDVSELFELEWRLFCALSPWQEVLYGLTLNGCKFVIACRGLSIREGITQSDLNRGIRGWSSMWECEIEMFFNKSSLSSMT